MEKSNIKKIFIFLSRIKATLSPFTRFLKPYLHKYVLILIIMAIVTGLSLMIPYMFKYLIDDVIPSKDFNKLWNFTLFYILINILYLSGSFLSKYMYSKISNNVMLDIRKDFFLHLIKLPISFFKNNKTGDIIHRINSDVTSLTNILTRSIIRFVNNMLEIIILTILLLRLDKQLFFIIVAILPFIFLNSTFFQPRIKKIVKKITETESGILSFFMEKFENVIQIKVYNNYDYENYKIKNKLNDLLKLNLKSVIIENSHLTISNIFMFSTFLCIFTFGGYKVMTSVITLGTLVAFTQYLWRVYGPMHDTLSLWTDLNRALVSMDRISEFLSIKTEQLELKDKSFSITKLIEFKDVTFGYNKDKLILNKISFELKKGKKYAFVGNSGCGKSTILNLICGFYEINSGNIKYDGKSYSEINLYDLRDKITLVTQDKHIFNDTVFNNIAYGNTKCAEKQINEVIQTFKVDSIINNSHLNNLVGDQGITLSGGQKQRISITRSSLKEADILLLDESTSELDSDNEYLIYKNLFNLFKNSTIVIVSHRISTIMDADEIFFIKNGIIIERGNHEELIKCKGEYYNLFKQQLFVGK